MAKLPVTQGATRRAYSRAARQARRRWLATKLMGQQPRQAEPREKRASREQLGTCFPAHGNYSSPGEGKCACLPGTGLRCCGLVDPASFTPTPLALGRFGLLSHPSTCPTLWPRSHSWAGAAGEWHPKNLEPVWEGLGHRLLVRGLTTDPCPQQGQKASGSFTSTPWRLAGEREGAGIGCRREKGDG